MSLFTLSVVSNLIANICLWLGGVVLVGLLIGRRRRRPHHFFGIKNKRRLLVYLASVPVQLSDEEPIYLRGNTGIPDTSAWDVKEYQTACPNYEFMVIPAISGLFSKSLDILPDVLAGLTDSLWIVKQPVIDFRLSPTKKEDIESGNTICIGGPVFNLVTSFYLRRGKPYLTIVQDTQSGKWRVKVAGGSGIDEFVEAEAGWDLGIINKFNDADTGDTVFVAAGLGVNATRAAAEYLVGSWTHLLKDYGGREFGVCLKCPDVTKDPTGYRQPQVIRQIPTIRSNNLGQ